MRTFLTGGTGFIGGRVARALRERGDEVAALVRSPERAADLRAAGCALVAGDLGDPLALRAAIGGADAVVHAAAVYRIGIPRRERPAMFDANVRGTERVLDAAIEAGVGRIVYVSTVNAFGNTGGAVADESWERPAGRYLSFYDETKYLAHTAAAERAARGAPVVIVQPGVVYGPGDHSEVGALLRRLLAGKLPAMAFGDLGATFCYVEDVAAGILAALDKGRAGASYVLGGERGRMRDLVAAAARLGGVRAPRLEMPAWAVKMGIPFGPIVGKMMGFPPNLGELVRASDGVTYWASDERARRELGYAPRPLEEGLRATLAAGL